MSTAKARKKNLPEKGAAWAQWTDGLHQALTEAKALLAQDSGLKSETIDGLMRSFHLIKGFAQALGLHGVQSVSHELEARLLASRAVDQELRDFLSEGVRKLDGVIARLHEIDLQAAAALGELAVISGKPARVSAVFARIESAAKGIALDLGCKLKFECMGGDLFELEPAWEGPLEAALLHAVRNSLDHGITKDHTQAPLEVRLSVERKGSELVIVCRDSGSGIDPARVREVARAPGALRCGDGFDEA
jgi:chemotaxis protein histidine kinase CheA